MTARFIVRPRPRVRAVVFASALAAGGALLAGQAPQRPTQPQNPTRDAAGNPQPATATALVSGVVVSTDSGRPIRRALVRLSGTTPGPSRTAVTDDQGAFVIQNVAAGQYTLTASKPGFLTATYGQKRPGSSQPGTPLSVAQAQRLERLTLAIPRGGVLTGTIVDDAGEPSFGTQVRALRYVMRAGERTLQTAGSAQTDDRGIYRIPALPPGDYVVIATPRDDSTTDLLKSAMELEMVAAARATAGTPGNGFVYRVGAPSSPTDDAGPTSGYAPVYYPGTMIANAATPVTVAIGEEKSGIDLQLQLVPLGRITGVITGGDPKALPGVMVQLIDTTQALPGMGMRTTRPGPDGTFSFTGVAPGQYTVSARSGPSMEFSVDSNGGTRMMVTRMVRPGSGPDSSSSGQAQPMWATADVSVDGRTPTNIALQLQPGLTVSGRIVFDGTSPPPPDVTQIRLVLSSASPADGRAASAMGQVDAQGQFRIQDVVPDKYRLTALAPRGWRPKSFDVSGRDALDFPLDVKANSDIAGAVLTLTDRSTTLSGTLQDAAGQPTADYTIIVFAEEEQYWTPQSRRIQATRPATDGRFLFQNLPAGTYRLVAVNDAEQDQWFDPAFLRQLAGASIRIQLGDGERKIQDLRVAR